MRWLVSFVIACGGTQGVAAPAGDDITRCEAGDGEACTRLGGANEGTVRGGGNAPLAFAYYKKACAAKSWKGCTELAKMYERGTGTPEDDAAAAKHYDLACANDHAYACWSRASMYNSWLRDCDPAMHDTRTYKRPPGCKGHVLETSKKMLELLRKSCRLHEEFACDVVRAYDAKPGSVSIDRDGFSEDWNFEAPGAAEPVWDDLEEQ